MDEQLWAVVRLGPELANPRARSLCRHLGSAGPARDSRLQTKTCLLAHYRSRGKATLFPKILREQKRYRRVWRGLGQMCRQGYNLSTLQLLDML